LHGGDSQFRKFAGVLCSCCSAKEEAIVSGALVDPVREDGLPLCTRRSSSAQGWSRRCIDGGVAFGVEAGQWRALQPLWAAGRWQQGGMEVDLSDHAVLRFVRTGQVEAEAVLRRPMPVKVGSVARGDRVAGLVREASGDRAWREQLQEEVEIAGGSGRSGLQAITAALRALGEWAATRAEGDGVVREGRSTALCEYHSWGRRLGTARKLRDEGVDFFACRCLLLFHPATGLHRVARSAWSSVEVWGAVIR
jgi:hypothetical protein